MAEHNCKYEKEIILMGQDISHIKELVDAKLTGFHAEMRANHDVLMSEMRAYNEVLLERVEVTIKLQQKTNGNVLEHDQEIKNLGKQIIDERNAVDLQIEEIKEKGRDIINHQRCIRWVVKHPVWTIVIALSLIGAVTAIIDYYGIQSVLDTINKYK